jgi:hypothetical protein
MIYRWKAVQIPQLFYRDTCFQIRCGLRVILKIRKPVKMADNVILL